MEEVKRLSDEKLEVSAHYGSFGRENLADHIRALYTERDTLRDQLEAAKLTAQPDGVREAAQVLVGLDKRQWGSTTDKNVVKPTAEEWQDALDHLKESLGVSR